MILITKSIEELFRVLLYIFWKGVVVEELPSTTVYMKNMQSMESA